MLIVVVILVLLAVLFVLTTAPTMMPLLCEPPRAAPVVEPPPMSREEEEERKLREVIAHHASRSQKLDNPQLGNLYLPGDPDSEGPLEPSAMYGTDLYSMSGAVPASQQFDPGALYGDGEPEVQGNSVHRRWYPVELATRALLE